MKNQSTAKRLRIYISSTDKFKHTPLYEVIVFSAKRYNLSGATVFKGIMGYGTNSPISSQKFWELTEKTPIVVEIIDEADKIEKFIEIIKSYMDKIKYGCVITSEDIHIVMHKLGSKNLE